MFDLLDIETLMLLKTASGGSLVEDTASGNPLTFTTDVAKKLKSLVLPFTPVQSGTGDPSPTNVRPISGVSALTVSHSGQDTSNPTTYPVTFPALGKNLLPNKTYVYGNNLIVGNDENTANISLKAGTYTFSVYSSKAVALIYQPDGGDMVNIKASGGSTGLRNASFTLQEDTVCKFLLYISGGVAASDVDWFQLEEGTVATPVYEPYTNTVYGGSLDLVTGVLTVEYECILTTWGEMAKGAVHPTTGYVGGFKNYNNPVKYPGGGGSIYNSFCNVAKFVWDTAGTAVPHFYNGVTSKSDYRAEVYLPSDTDDSTNIQVIGMLITPQTYQLTPQQITALIGTNTIWSDTNGTNSATYLKKG